ncbi:MAG TPA: hypothetical protein DEQ80_04835 [Anaerolinea thermolimosa]|uniref:Uncharacterized protein n=1 Tax=Anaerolinea thermolimosa TaxID=229919 RepID=A0A3D1JG13_9CHLR|nr:hypothetical protein [Anaerolinea thermolimosa]GAP05637.1 hypothetical protein ATHL_00478 [Anaerolinea thermolimosa]HCE17165.1 hypothetical protein [Anaerolinea thermolimosa]
MFRFLQNLWKQMDWRIWITCLIFSFLVATSLAWREPPANRMAGAVPGQEKMASIQMQEATTDQWLDSTPTKTPLPPELMANYQQTTGVIVFAGVVVLVVVGGVLREFLRGRHTGRS